MERHLSRLDGLPLDLKSVLQHLIVSPHGEIDKGALRQPALPEATALHYLDEIDARLEQAWRLIDQGPDGEEWTAYVPSLGRQLYQQCPPEPEADLRHSGGVEAPFGIVASKPEPVVGSNGQR